MHVNPKSHLVEISHIVKMARLMAFHVLSSGNSMTHLVEIYFLGKLWHFTCKISHAAMRVHTCRNEVIVEWYRRYMYNEYFPKNHEGIGYSNGKI